MIVNSKGTFLSRRQFCALAGSAVAAIAYGLVLKATRASAYDYGEYIFPTSNLYELSYYDVQGLSAYTLYLGRNEIYARHGYIFSSSELRSYFSSKSWYVPRYTADRFDEAWLSLVEQRNIATILKREREINSPYVSKATPAPAPAPVYIFPSSDVRYLDINDLKGCSPYTLYLGRNEIYARHGFIFESEDLRRYFSGQSWYVPRYTVDRFDASVLTRVEQANILFIRDYERSIGSPYV